MTIIEIIEKLRSGQAAQILETSEAAADALEFLDERLAIMGELLTEKEWTETETEARRRLQAEKSAAEAARIAAEGITRVRAES